MNSSLAPAAAHTPDIPCLSPVLQHRSFRGVTVVCDLLCQFSMYTIDLDEVGLFISDSRPEAFKMAFAALSAA